MAYSRLSQNATMVKRGWGQVEPNHLSARFTGEIYAQLPAKADIEVLENGQFVKYDYVNGVVDFTGKGEWMLVYNEIKVYRDWETDEDWAMMRRDQIARVYSPVGANGANGATTNPGVGAETKLFTQETYPVAPELGRLPVGPSYEREVLTIPAMMPGYGTDQATLMTPRVFKTHEGDIFTTNTIAAEYESVNVGDLLTPNDKGYLAPTSDENGFVWQVVKKYNLPDLQPAVKVMRIH